MAERLQTLGLPAAGRRFRAALPDDDVALTADTCPFPASDMFKATVIKRNLTIASLPAGSSGNPAAAVNNSSSSNSSRQLPGAVNPNAAANSTGPPYKINCNYLTDRFLLAPGAKVTLSNVILLNCRTDSPFGFFKKQPGAQVHFDHVVDARGSVCVPNELLYLALRNNTAYTGATHSQQLQGNQSLALVTEGSNWCAGAANSSMNSTPGLMHDNHSPLPANSTNTLCNQQALLMIDAAYQQPVTDPTAAANTSGTANQFFNFSAVDSAILCPEPITADCIREKGYPECLANAYAAVNPDNHRACPVMNGNSLQSCLADGAYGRLVVLQSATMNLSTSPATSDPIRINRNVTIMSDPRGPRLTWDCGLLSNRFQLEPGHTLTLYHIILANCTSTRLLNFIRLSAGSRLILNDTFVVQPPGLCLPMDPQPVVGVPGPNGIFTHYARPEEVPGVQSFGPGQPGRWCNQSDFGMKVDSSTSPADNSSYGVIGQSARSLGLFANTTGIGPEYASTIAAPATVPYYVNPTWPSNELCTRIDIIPPILLKDYASDYTPGWVDGTPVNTTQVQHIQQQQQQLQPLFNVTPTPPDQQQPGSPRFGSDLDLSNGSYSGTVFIQYINSALICPVLLTPAQVAAGCSDPGRAVACQAAAYAAVDPDRQMVPGAAAYEAARAAGAAGGGNRGVQVVLPAVLASVGGAAILAGILAAFIRRRRRTTTKAAAAAKPNPHQHLATPPHSQQQQQQQHNPLAWLGSALGVQSSGGRPSWSSSDPGRQLLGQYTPTTPTTGQSGMTPVGGGRFSRDVTPDGIQLNVLLGAGSFGRVYAGTWLGAPVAVKVITHSGADDSRIGQELALSLSFDHPNLVRALHYTRMRINPQQSPEVSEIEGGTDLFLPQGAVGVFELPTNWAVVQRTQAATAPGSQAPAIDTETWIVMDLMDKGNLAAALRHGTLFLNDDGSLNMARLLRRAADVAAGLAYLHSRNVCHGDLKWENVLLKTEAQDPDGCLAKIADFGLSRALAFGQSHLSTRRYGTVTHMPPELLVAGKLTPSADVYSFGIMMWELVTRSLPFQGLHHGEIIHRVVTADLRPGPWPPMSGAGLSLPADYIPLAQDCWARRTEDRPDMTQVLQRLLQMMQQVEGDEGV